MEREETMGRIEFHASILETGHIALPPKIMEQRIVKPNQVVKITIETEPQPGMPAKRRYAFEEVRKLLKGIEGDMSAEILAYREERR
jgi:hypothetical protein